MKRLCSFFLIGILFLCSPVLALTVEELDPGQEWQLTTLTITGNQHFLTDELRAVLVTHTRPWYAPWRARPRFDLVAFATDMQRLARFYQARGYYKAKVSYDLDVHEADHLVAAHVTIDEGEPVKVAQVTLAISDQPALTPDLEALRPRLPLTEGAVFTEEHYQQAEAQITEFFLQQGRGRVKVDRKAEVVLERDEARVQYTVEVGPPTVFGETRVEGVEHVDPALVTRELTYKPGEPFSPKALTTSRQNLLKLDLFSAVRFLQEESPADPSILPIRVQVEEKPFHEWKLGVGYGTEDELRGQIRWRHNNWFGGGRRLDIGVKVSAIVRDLAVNFLQPHFLGLRNRLSLTLGSQEVDEPGYLLHSTRLQPRLEREFTDGFTGFLAYRLEYDQLNSVSPSTIRLLQGFKRKGVLSGLSLGLLRNTTDDLLNPTSGEIVSLTAEQVGLGGDFDFYKLQGEAKWYHLLTSQIVFASRLKLGVADPFGHSAEVPLFERFYAGGANSVRGYGRHRLGPLSASDDPVGGRSLVEGSLELRRQFSEKIGGALFLDFGQVSLRSFDLPFDDLRYAAGFGVRYTTPVGPVRLDLGFPFSPPRGDQPWQVHFSIGQFF